MRARADTLNNSSTHLICDVVFTWYQETNLSSGEGAVVFMSMRVGWGIMTFVKALSGNLRLL